MIEVWKNVPGYNGKYQLNTEGECRRVYPSGKTRKMTPFVKQHITGSKRLFVGMTNDEGKKKDECLHGIMALTFLGPVPEGHVPYHKNGNYDENHIQNIAYISRQELGKLTGGRSRRQAVAKIDANGEIVEIYSSAREAARKNFMSRQTVTDRCNGACKGAFAPDGYAYAWEDSEKSMKEAIRKIEQANGYMPKATGVEFEF